MTKQRGHLFLGELQRSTLHLCHLESDNYATLINIDYVSAVYPLQVIKHATA